MWAEKRHASMLDPIRRVIKRCKDNRLEKLIWNDKYFYALFIYVFVRDESDICIWSLKFYIVMLVGTHVNCDINGILLDFVCSFYYKCN